MLAHGHTQLRHLRRSRGHGCASTRVPPRRCTILQQRPVGAPWRVCACSCCHLPEEARLSGAVFCLAYKLLHRFARSCLTALFATAALRGGGTPGQRRLSHEEQLGCPSSPSGPTMVPLCVLLLPESPFPPPTMTSSSPARRFSPWDGRFPPFPSTGAAAPPATRICSWSVLGLLLSWVSHGIITPHQSLLGNPWEHFNGVKTPGVWNTLARAVAHPAANGCCLGETWARPALSPAPRITGAAGGRAASSSFQASHTRGRGDGEDGEWRWGVMGTWP